jgi:hypothetical protein
MTMKPRIEVIFRKGKPVTAFFHLVEASSGRTGRQIAIRPPMVAHYDAAGHPSGLEVPLPLTVQISQINEALREVGGEPVLDADMVPLRSL